MTLWHGSTSERACTGELRTGMERLASVFSVQGGEIVVDEKFLAAKLGPSRSRASRKCVGVTCRYRALPDRGGEAGGSINDDPVLAGLDSTVLSEKRVS